MSENETTETASPIDPLVGKTLAGRFVLKRLLSRGGMGKVYLATQLPLQREVALKVLDVVDDDGEFRRRFFMEASLCAKLRHPHTVRIYDYGATDDGIFFMVMEYLQGQSLHDMLRTEAPVDPLRAVVIARRICASLTEAHEAGIVHRDLKPANIFLVRHGDDPEFPKVIDFGLVKELGKESELSRTGHVLGSPLYMSPEQVQGDAVDGRTDVYAVGSMLYYALSGKTAVKRGNPMMVLMAQVQKAAPPFSEACPGLNLPPIVEWTVRRCIEKSSEDRFLSMHELGRALRVCEHVLAGELPSSVELELSEGQVVLPPGVEFSEDLARPAGYESRRSSLPPPTPIPGATPAPTDPTLSPTTGLDPSGHFAPNGSRGGMHPAEVSRSQSMGVIFLGMTASVISLMVFFVATIAGTFWWVNSQKAEPIVTAPGVEAPNVVAVHLTTEPAGAEVLHEGLLLGTTPLTRNLTPGEPLVVSLRADGFEERTVQLDAAQSALHVNLEKSEKPVSSPSPVPSSTTVEAPAPSVAPKPSSEKPVPNMSDIRDPWAD